MGKAAPVVRYLTSISQKQQCRISKSCTDTGYVLSFASVQNDAHDLAATQGGLALLPEVASLKVASPELPTPACSFGSGEATVALLLCVD